jgi:hypothetical protein
MTIRQARRFLFVFTFLVSAPLLATPLTPQEGPCPARQPEGAWETAGGGTQILFKGDEIVLRKKAALSVAKILTREPCKLVVRYEGLRSTWTLKPGTAETMELRADEPMTLQALPTTPPQLDINPPTLPSPGPVSPTEAKAVEEELLRHAGKDQEVLKNPALKDKRSEVVADNHRYLQDLTQKFGWIDIPRFGKSAASAAILLANTAVTSS